MIEVPPSLTKLPVDWGYYGWVFTSLCGVTPAFAWAGSRVKCHCAVLPGQEAAWWQAANQVLGQLARHYAPLSGWLEQVNAAEPVGRDCLLLMGWQALQATLGVPGYPVDVSEAVFKQVSAIHNTNDPECLRHLTLYTACPYDDFVRVSLQLTGAWLSWSHAAWQQGRFELTQDQLQLWCTAFEQLPTRLPSATLMALHQRLWQQGITWQWLGGAQTRIGEGVRQHIVTGVPADLSLDDADVWRVPIYSVTGSVGKTTTARLLWQLLQGSGQTLALAASDGAWIGEQRVATGDCIGGLSARALLQSPAVQAAVFEQGRGGILKQGVPYARSDVAILLNVQAVHLKLDGIDTLEQMANTKALGIGPARLAVLNHDDAQCRRLGALRVSTATIWFSVTAVPDTLKALSLQVRAALGVTRDGLGEPQSITLWQAGQLVRQWSLQGVAPYHGLLGEKTLEELLAAVAAGWFGPLALPRDDWPERLQALCLDSSNHAFRTSVHRQGDVVFVLDKAAEQASLQDLERVVNQLVLREGCQHRIVALVRSAGEPPDRHRESAQALHRFMDEFVCFDRPETYTSSVALPIYSAGDIPLLMRDAFERHNAEQGVSKPVTVVADWTAAEVYLRERLASLAGKTLLLINQPSTGVTELNQRILAFATSGLATIHREDLTND